MAAALAACGGGDEGVSAPASTVSPTTLALNPLGSTTTTGVPTRTPGAQPMPAIAELQPGVRYEAADVTPAVSVQVAGPGWKSFPLPPFKLTDLVDVGKNIRPDGESDISVAVLRVSDVWTKHLVPDPVGLLESQYVVPAPADLEAWLRANPYLRVSAASATTVGGFAATALTVEVPPLPAEAEGTCHGDRCVILFSLESPGGYLPAFEGSTAQYWLVETGTERLVVFMGLGEHVDPAQRDALTKEGEAVVASLKFT